jgi:hypothetical protein
MQKSGGRSPRRGSAACFPYYFRVVGAVANGKPRGARGRSAIRIRSAIQ